MAVNSNLNSQGTAPGGAYIQPSPGVVIQATTDTDVNGLLQQSVAGPNTGLAYFGVSNYRDAIITVQAGSTAAAPSGGGTVVSITPGTAGFWEISGLMGVTGTTTAAADSNNMALRQGGTVRTAAMTFPVQSTTGNNTQGVIPPVVLNVGASDVIAVTAVGAATGSSVYAATLVARRVG